MAEMDQVGFHPSQDSHRSRHKSLLLIQVCPKEQRIAQFLFTKAALPEINLGVLITIYRTQRSV